MAFLIVIAVLVVLAFFVIGIYNGLVTARNGYQNAFAQIDVQLTRRHDLIPNIVEVAKGYMKHERETLEAVISASPCGDLTFLVTEYGRPFTAAGFGGWCHEWGPNFVATEQCEL